MNIYIQILKYNFIEEGHVFYSFIEENCIYVLLEYTHIHIILM